MKKILVIVALLIVLVGLFLAVQGQRSRTGQAPGLRDGLLNPCPNKPNCVCSEYPQAGDHYIEPVALGDLPVADPLPGLTSVIRDFGGTVVSARGDYLAVTFSSSLFGFVDDVEFRVDVTAGVIHIRSASRVGYGDFHANRNRVEQLRHRLGG